MKTLSRRILWGAGGTASAAAIAFGVCEALGWPFLAQPMQNYLSRTLDRPVRLLAQPDATGADGHVNAQAVRVRLLGRLRIETPRLEVADRAEVAPPASSATPAAPMLRADGVRLSLRWRDLWTLAWGGPELTVHELRAAKLELHARRTKDGRANWQFGAAAGAAASTSAAQATASAPPVPGERTGVRFEQLAIDQARGSIDDALLVLQATFSASLRADVPPVADAPSAVPDTNAFTAQAQGRWRGQPLRATLTAGSPLPLVEGDAIASPAVPVKATLDAGPTQFRFDGRVGNVLRRQQLEGRFSLVSPSLGNVGDALRVTLPRTPPLRIEGRLAHAVAKPAGVWQVWVAAARIGQSDLAGEMAYDMRPPGRGGGPRPLLSGELRSKALWLSDLGPAVGTPGADAPASTAAPGRVLPQRSFDLPSLRAMDADVGFAIQTLRLTADTTLRPIAPLNAHLRLEGGVLQLEDIVAGLAQGRVEGRIQLDAKRPETPALWQTRLRLSQVRLEQFVPAAAGGGRPVPWATGRIAGRLALDGQGRSTAELLASADGSLTLVWTDGTVSHLAVEAAGLDIAQGLGRLLRGDEPIAVRCGAAVMRVKDGRAVPDPAVVDTGDSTLWLEGQASLADEKLDLRVFVAPKDRTLLALRTPLVVRGSFLAPQAGIDGSGVAKRVVPAALLALVNPLAAVIPLLDGGDREEAHAAAASCQRSAADTAAPRQHDASGTAARTPHKAAPAASKAGKV